jgi:hypothetical protein
VKSKILKLFLPVLIIAGDILDRVDHTIHFDNKFNGMAIKINNISPDGMLISKPLSNRFFSEMFPQFLFSWRHVLTQIP